VAVVVATQTKDSFFHVFFFKENLEKNERIWENIIDLEARLILTTLTQDLGSGQI
jgi:hypothetical protein